MFKEFYGDHLAPLSWGENLPSVWDKPFNFSEQEWAHGVTEQQFIRNSAENLAGDYQKIGEIMRDTFVGLHDRMAHFAGREDDPVSTEVFRHLSESEEWSGLQEKTRGDTMASALATCHIAREFLANLPEEVQEALQRLHSSLGSNVDITLRYSGTESKLRLKIRAGEEHDQCTLEKEAEAFMAVAKQAIG